MTSATLEPPPAAKLDPQAVLLDKPTEEEQEAPSVFSVVNRYIVGRAEVSPPAGDGSRVVRLISVNGGTIIEANLAPQLCDFVSAKLVEIPSAEEGEDGG